MRDHLRQRFSTDVGIGLPGVQLLQEFDNRVIAVGRLALQAATDDRAQGSGNGIFHVGGRFGNLARTPHQAGDGGVRVVRRFPGQQFVEDKTDAEDIGALIELGAQGLLGRHVLHGADDGAGLGHAGIAEGAGETEVHHDYASLLVAHDVLRLQVAVDDPFGMGGVERAADLLNHGNRFFRRVLAILAKHGAHIFAIDVFHGDEANAVGFAQVVNANYIFMRDIARKNQFLFETLQDGRIGGQFGANYFERDQSVEFAVTRLVDSAHATLSEHAQDLVTSTKNNAGLEREKSRNAGRGDRRGVCRGRHRMAGRRGAVMSRSD